MRLPFVVAPAFLFAMACAKGHEGTPDGPTQPMADANVNGPDASCGTTCDSDGDGVPDGNDKCPNTPPGAAVNQQGCADSQLLPMLNPNFPPYGLTWTQSGDIGRAGGLTWTYTGINRGDLFHIYWMVCDDPNEYCGLSLDGPIDTTEKFTLSDPDTDLPGGKLGFTNTTHIGLDDGSMPQLTGRLTVTIDDGAGTVIPFSNVIVFGATTRMAKYGAEIKGTGFHVVVLFEIQDPTSGVWTPAADYYDGAPKPMTAPMNLYESFDGAFYDK